MTTSDLAALQKLAAYREERQHVFQSDGALEWFVRRHRALLIARGALVLIGNQWHALPSAFDAVVLDLGAAAARAQLNRRPQAAA
jgi:hypothetical protein